MDCCVEKDFMGLSYNENKQDHKFVKRWTRSMRYT